MNNWEWTKKNIALIIMASLSVKLLKSTDIAMLDIVCPHIMR